MNIEITKEEHQGLLERTEGKRLDIVIGSRMFNTIHPDSDTDVLHLFNKDQGLPGISSIQWLPNIHQLWYKDEKNNVDHLWSYYEQFWKNQASGDSTINSDVILFTNFIGSLDLKMRHTRTYKVLKAYLGFAKRDLKEFKKSGDKTRLFHAGKGLMISRLLINKELPKEYMVQDLDSKVAKYSKLEARGAYEVGMEEHDKLRGQLNSLYEEGNIPTYYTPGEGFGPKGYFSSELLKLWEANNIKEFKYD